MSTDQHRVRDGRQLRAHRWGVSAFGQQHMGDRVERGARFLEEAVELAQVASLPRSWAHRIVGLVYDKPLGEPAKKVGDVGLTLLLLAQCLGLSADECEAAVMDYVESKPREHWAVRNEAKQHLTEGAQ